MFGRKKNKKIASLKSMLLWWVVSSGIVLVIVYSVLIEYYFRFGVTLRTQANFERIAVTFAENYATDAEAALPVGPYLDSYRNKEDIPVLIRQHIPESGYQHGEITVFGYDEEHDHFGVQSLPEQLPYCGANHCEIMFFYAHQLNETEWLYMSQGIIASDRIHDEADIVDGVATLIGLLSLTLFGGLAFLLVKKITSPVQQLQAWADGLSLEHLDEKVPDFKYKELNQVALQLNSAFERIGQSLEKEHRFLQHASHELRTPIAVASGNLELLELVADRTQRSEAENKAMSRLKYAVSDMRELTETLLWLNRDGEKLPNSVKVELKPLINQLVESNKYLLEGKPVNVSVVGVDAQVVVQETLCSIVLANLIRNAFQYTHEGTVLVSLSPYSINIYNKNDVEPDNEVVDREYGFGLGLDLVEQIAERLGWMYQYSTDQKGRSCTIFLPHN